MINCETHPDLSRKLHETLRSFYYVNAMGMCFVFSDHENIEYNLSGEDVDVSIRCGVASRKATNYLWHLVKDVEIYDSKEGSKIIIHGWEIMDAMEEFESCVDHQWAVKSWPSHIPS